MKMDETILTIWIVGLLIVANVFIAVGIILLALKNYLLYVFSFFGALLYLLLVMFLIKSQLKARG